MTTPSHEDPFGQALPPVDPRQLPPGFYFPPGTGPSAPTPRRGGVKWIIAVVAVLVATAIAIGVALLVMRDDGDDASSASPSRPGHEPVATAALS
ncbi:MULTISPECIES: hypothetical protein [unclassified Mycobacterium]|uniref:hypothetical protein n=1 Tax=unclassified Mycobacterium TaxID=2642494 RepID=UPI0029C62696|nr:MULTISPECIES: hypothetical protein [unclassified Mycobacterium]